MCSYTTSQFYYIMKSEVKVDDEISVFGLLKYDAKNGLYVMDKPMSMLKLEAC